jgi:hypothetical protein
MNEIGITPAAEYLGLLDGLDALGSVQEIERLSAVSSVVRPNPAAERPDDGLREGNQGGS